MFLLRLLADDLTGALDTAARFVGLTGPLPVFFCAPDAPPAGNAAFDSGTREVTATAAASVVAGFAPMLAGGVAFKKLDSLLRGHPVAELVQCLDMLGPAHCIIAPAFPFQGRITRGGRQYVQDAAGRNLVGVDLGGELRAAGLPVTLACPGDPLPPGISLWDAETDADLARIARAGLAADGRVLWCGSSGLAGALAGDRGVELAKLRGPILGLFGSDHPVTAAQLRGAKMHLLRLQPDQPADGIIARLQEAGVALATFDLPPSLHRHEAARRINAAMAALTRQMTPPGTLVVAGGETLRALCLLLGASHLEVHGQIVPGVPQSILRGGRWDGVTIVSKSGAFGAPGLLRQLVAGAPLHEELGA